MRRIRVKTRAWRRAVRDQFAEWEGVFDPMGEDAYFAGHEAMPEFRFDVDSFEPAQAWWLAELSRLAYTPDQKEEPRDRGGRFPRRGPILAERTPFEEILSIHKTGNHASIYRFSDGREGTILCFRGTSKLRQWIMNTVIRPHGWRRFRLADDPEGARVHSGFYVFFKRAWPLLREVLHVQPKPWVFTGHSLGGALATIASVVSPPDLLCTFGAPKVGNAEFYELSGPSRVWRIVNDRDLVPRLPLPDPKLGEKVLVHGTAARVLRAGALEQFEEGEEDLLPFSPERFLEEFSSPPPWLCDHRIGEYCRIIGDLAGEEGTKVERKSR
ncbi:MAG: lipase family protein [Verrucomicrobiota bacterium]